MSGFVAVTSQAVMSGIPTTDRARLARIACFQSSRWSALSVWMWYSSRLAIRGSRRFVILMMKPNLTFFVGGMSLISMLTRGMKPRGVSSLSFLK